MTTIGNRVDGQVEHWLVDHGKRPPKQLARQAEHRAQVEDEQRRGFTHLSTRTSGWYRIAVSGASEREALDRAAAVVELYKPHTTWVRDLGQYALAREFVPGEPLVVVGALSPLPGGQGGGGVAGGDGGGGGSARVPHRRNRGPVGAGGVFRPVVPARSDGSVRGGADLRGARLRQVRVDGAAVLQVDPVWGPGGGDGPGRAAAPHAHPARARRHLPSGRRPGWATGVVVAVCRGARTEPRPDLGRRAGTWRSSATS